MSRTYRFRELQARDNFEYLLQPVRVYTMPRNRASSEEPYRLAASEPFSLRRFASPENLMSAYRALTARGGPAAGVDGIKMKQLSQSELFKLIRGASERLRNRTYQPAPILPVRILKSSGRGYRTLKLQVLVDRVIAKAMQLYLAGLADDGSYSFTPSVWAIWRRLANEVTSERRYLAIDDIADCFDHVDLNQLANVLREVTNNDGELASLVIQTVTEGAARAEQQASTPRTPDPAERQPSRRRRRAARDARGILQGSPASPVVMELLLATQLDRYVLRDREDQGPVTAQNELNNHVAYMRYVDNLFALSNNPHDAVNSMSNCHRILATNLGMRLKERGTFQVDLRDNQDQEVLGVIPRMIGNRLVFQIPGNAWGKLADRLLRCQGSLDVESRATEILQGFADAYGPAFAEDMRTPIITDLIQVVRQAQIDIPSLELVLSTHLETSWQRWESYRLGNPDVVLPPSQDDVSQILDES